ncbi:hypothetical protein HW555_013323 [Spodoptera exigua]|uniref:Protein FAM98A n=1 Tax=Spodoptera exigua TaxID=7107 RepID=A0A835KY87_SPOEX|nr:hypothetical protein HW555_013323 [Spodoptera exigua]
MAKLRYEGPLTEEAAFAKALDGGPKSLDFTKLVHILAEEIKKLCNLEETVNMMNDPDESSSFLLELSSFLKELKCPYKKLVTGHMSSRLQTKEDRLLLLDYLISELMAARMVNVDGPKEKQGAGMEIVVQESPTARDLKNILIALKFNKPPPNITAEMLFSKLEAKLKDTIQKEGNQLVGKPLYNKALSEKEWKQLENAFTEMFEEYRLRRETLITRLECTIQSFEWSDRLKTKKDIIQSTYRPKRETLKVKPDVKLADFLAARTSLLQVEKTSSASVRKNTQTDVNKVIIGRVPDRGGRPNEQQPPPPEMPSWQQRNAGEEDREVMEGAGDEAAAEDECRADIARGLETTAVILFLLNPKFNGRSQQNRNYQTYEVPPGGYSNQNQYSHAQTYEPDQNYNQHNQGYSGYNQGGYDSMGSYNQGYQGGGGGGGYKKPYQNNQGYQHNQGYQANQGYQSNQGYQGRGGYQNEHDDRDRRGRGGYRGGRR